MTRRLLPCSPSLVVWGTGGGGGGGGGMTTAYSCKCRQLDRCALSRTLRREMRQLVLRLQNPKLCYLYSIQHQHWRHKHVRANSIHILRCIWLHKCATNPQAMLFCVAFYKVSNCTPRYSSIHPSTPESLYIYLSIYLSIYLRVRGHADIAVEWGFWPFNG